MTDDPILRELKVATGYENIYKEETSYVIDMITDSYLHGIDDDIKNDGALELTANVKGLCSSHQTNTYYLAFDSFRDVPISFLVKNTRGSAITQYWTLNGALHRTDDKPAYVRYNYDKKSYSKEWYWYGMRHRMNTKPSTEFGSGYERTEYYDGYEKGRELHEKWDNIEYYYIHEGVRKALYPDNARLEEVERYSNILNPQDFTEVVRIVTIYWNPDNIKKKKSKYFLNEFSVSSTINENNVWSLEEGASLLSFNWRRTSDRKLFDDSFVYDSGMDEFEKEQSSLWTSYNLLENVPLYRDPLDEMQLIAMLDSKFEE